jgi:FlaA1/EpsC-like NDP-sugar epimerase
MSHTNRRNRAQPIPLQLRRALPLALADVIILLTAYLIVLSVRIGTSSVDLERNQTAFLALAVAVMLLSMKIFGGYQRLWRKTSGHDVQVIVEAVVVSTLILTTLDFFLRPRPLPLSVVLTGGIVAMTGFVAIRYRSRLVSGVRWRWRAIWHQEFPEPKLRVLVVGAGDSGQTTAWRLKYRAPDSSQGFDIAGFVDDDPNKQGMIIESCRVLGTCADIPDLVDTYRIELIIVAIHNVDGPNFRRILGYCEGTTARIKIVPDVFSVINGTHGAPPLRDVQAEDLLGRQAVGWHQAVDVSVISHRVVLVTGAAGSIGSELCRQMLKHQPAKLIMLDNNESGLHDLVMSLKTEQNEDCLETVLADITNRRTITRVFEEHRPQVIFHSAAYKHVPMLEDYPNEAVRVNIGGTQQVAGLARDYGAERFVLISTDKAVNPASVMGASKRICELLMHAIASQGGHRTLFTSVRFGNVLGSRGSVVPLFTRQIESGGPVTVTDPQMTRYFMTIPEAVNLVIHAACLTKGDDLFMLRMGEVVRIVDLAERMIRMRGLVPNKDIPIKFIGARPGEKLHEELHSERETTVPTIHPHIVELLASTNGLQPVSFADTLDKLFHAGLSVEQDALSQLQHIIAMGEQHEMNQVS